ncbi:hypothetical protein BOTBODRAFT_38633 [Botryobasidium botryosum FD-172 SS1]|uniref:AB hydrolase-1 domain-containing protein n=1 Tax=Botryobasidium botryosum (strain FD-172 SS1) TaxID=930990 RepID=A0A067M6Y9_BOTB1|nr:hypothetical protein BOTBODRAFT_38633 [Botryobasidium botryosum FD-172 SS1]
MNLTRTQATAHFRRSLRRSLLLPRLHLASAPNARLKMSTPRSPPRNNTNAEGDGSCYPSYARPEAPFNIPPILTRNLLPLLTKNTPVAPNLPSPPRPEAFTSTHTLTTHVFPAAFPRHPSSPLPRAPTATGRLDQEQRERLLRNARDIVDLRRPCYKGEGCVPAPGNEGDTDLWLVINRYARDEGPRRGGVTLLAFHANGFHKETWEPTFTQLLDLEARNGNESAKIDEIWSLDYVNQGDSALINEGKLGDIFDWADNARDILNLLLNYLPSCPPPSSSHIPVSLDRVPVGEAEQRKVRGFDKRTIVGIGHSIGGCSVTRAALQCPQLFDSLILVDPVITPTSADSSPHTNSLATKAAIRRSAWPSREEARDLLSRSPFFGAWHPSALDKYIEHALCPDPATGGVRLKMDPMQETVVFADRVVPREVWELLPTLDPRIELRWIMAGTENVTTSGDANTQSTVWRRPQNSSNVRIPSAGHLIAQEAPIELAEEIFRFLQRKYGSTSGGVSKL